MELVPLGPGFGVQVKGVTMLDVATDAEAYKPMRSGTPIRRSRRRRHWPPC